MGEHSCEFKELHGNYG